MARFLLVPLFGTALATAAACTAASPWLRWADSPVLLPGGPAFPGGPRSVAVSDPDVLFDAEEGKWKMWFAVGWVEGTQPRLGIKYAESPDGFRWTAGDALALAPGALATDWDFTNTETPCVVKVPDAPASRRYYLWYSGGNVLKRQIRGYAVYQIGLAFSADGKAFTRLEASESPYGKAGLCLMARDVLPGVAGTRDGVAADPEVVRKDGFFRLWFTSIALDAADSVLAAGISTATSADGIHWNPSAKNPLPSFQQLDRPFPKQPSVLWNPAKRVYEMWYTSDTDAEKAALAPDGAVGYWYAGSPNGEDWTTLYPDGRDFVQDASFPFESVGLQTGTEVVLKDGRYWMFYPAYGTKNVPSGFEPPVVWAIDMATRAADPVTLQIPVVLDATGAGGARFASDLLLANRSPAASRVTLTFLPAPGASASETLGAGSEKRIPNVITYLRAKGIPLPPSPVAGSLLVRFEDVFDEALVFAGSRTHTPNPNTQFGGSFGLFTPGFLPSLAPTTEARIFGLRKDVAFRWNLALLDVPTGRGPPVLSIQLFDGESGLPTGAPITVALGNGEWRQLDSVLAASGARGGWAQVTKVGGGTDAFFAYGVENDGGRSGGGTSDGSLFGPDAAEGLVPIVLRTGASGTVYATELVLANPTAAPATATLRYVNAPQLISGGATVVGTIPLAPGRQLRIPDTIVYLREVLGLPLFSSQATQGGVLEVSGASAYARTFCANPDPLVGGTFGLAYPAVPPAARARTEAWVYGLVQNATSRSNLAIADARILAADPVTYTIDLFDPAAGAPAPAASFVLRLAGGEWRQINGILSTSGPPSAWARVRASPPSDFVVYGVVNDGARPGTGTSDGSYLPMSGAR